MQPCVGLSLYKLIQEDPGQESPSLESERTVGAGRHWCMGHHERCGILKAGIHFWKILVSPAGDSWNLVYTGEFTGQAAWSGPESNWSLGSLHHQYFLRDQVQLNPSNQRHNKLCHH